MKLSRKKDKRRHEIIEVRETNKTQIHIQQIKTEIFGFISNKQKQIKFGFISNKQNLDSYITNKQGKY